jgi:bifunctional non-homologous end joining protein LigD
MGKATGARKAAPTSKAKSDTKPPSGESKAPSRKRSAAPDRLRTYRSMRDFDVTAEPAGAAPETPEQDGSVGGRFVVQRHRARRLHYDLRLEMDGVLVSWAVPKGPTLDPGARHLAIHVEDHPIEYRDFEGVIPGGEYGGGDVIVWDRGTWTPDKKYARSPRRAVERGELHFDLHGEKLAGRFALVRSSRQPDRSGKEQWLLLHKRDEDAVAGWDPEDHPRSVKSGRTNDQVAAAPEAMWNSDAPAERAEVPLVPDRSWEPPTKEELAALDALRQQGTWVFQERELRLTNLDKVLFPASGKHRAFTKRDLIRYYATMAPVILPYLEGRPLNLHRYPNGVERSGFWQKALPSHAPSWMGRWHNDEADPGETEWYAVVEEPAALAWMANWGALELHAWTSRAARPHEPTYALIDIDPGSKTTFDEVVELARLYRAALEHLGLVGRPKVSGRRGIQIWVPIRPGYTFEDTREWVEIVSRAIGDTVPQLVSWVWQKADRRGKARLDYTQNAINKTLVAPYSVRAAAGAPVSMPITWDELDEPDLRPDGWTMRTAAERVERLGDVFSDVLAHTQMLPELS